MSATLEAMQRWRADDARDTLRRHPEIRAERIATHYLNCAAEAAMLRALIRQKQFAPRGADLTDVDRAIEHYTRRIQAMHFTDLGIPLDWP